MRHFLFVISFIFTYSITAQVNYGTPSENEIPKKLENLPVAIKVMHFPEVNHPIKIDDLYYWKHATGLMCETDEISITEFGAYLYYNNQWNLRKTYKLKDLDKFFGTNKQILLQGQPYVWPENWRIGDQLFGGWALWYFIGTNSEGKTVCGFATIHTTDNLLIK